MTSSTEQKVRPAREELGRALLDTGSMDSGWWETFRAVDRAGFLPEVMWPYDMDTGRTVAVSKADDPAAWFRYADANVPIVTQWDDGKHSGTQPGKASTSSASILSVVFSMLGDLDVQPGHRVLDIGTGTGYNSALLEHRLGSSNVVTVEVDEAVAASAREALVRSGHPVGVIAATASSATRRAPRTTASPLPVGCGTSRSRGWSSAARAA